MIKHYNDLIFSEIVKQGDYSFSNPEFGKSNTDQSYYEPNSSLIANAQKSGSVSSSLHNDAEKSIAEIRKQCSFLPQNMTQEEIQSYLVHQEEVAKSAIDDVNATINSIKDEVNLRNQIVQKSTESE